jgi:hypothetical protein
VLAGVITTAVANSNDVQDTPQIRDGRGDAARFGTISDLLLDSTGDILVLDTLADRTVIRRVTPDGLVTTVGENLQRVENGRSVRPFSLSRDSQGAFVFTYTDGTVRRSDATGVLTVLGGAADATDVVDGVGTSARFFHPGESVVDRDDRIYVIDGLGGLVRLGTPVQSAPSIVTQPASATVNSGAPAQFSVVATGYPAVATQWYFNGVAISGATSPTYSIAAATAANAGDYTVRISNAQGSVTSEVARLTVSTPPPPGGGSSGSGSGPTSGGGGGGGGGANEPWFTLAFGALWAARRFFRRGSA